MFFHTIFVLFPVLCLSLRNTTPVIRGSTKPFENFDPLGFSKIDDKISINYLREAELKHCRVAMISCLVIPATELQTHLPSIHNFDNLNLYAQILLVSGVAESEFRSMLSGWKNPFTNSFQLNHDYQPGDFGFGDSYDFTSEKDGLLLDKELNNGRLAMIGSLGMIAQELATGHSIF